WLSPLPFDRADKRNLFILKMANELIHPIGAKRKLETAMPVVVHYMHEVSDERIIRMAGDVRIFHPEPFDVTIVREIRQMIIRAPHIMLAAFRCFNGKFFAKLPGRLFYIGA